MSDPNAKGSAVQCACCKRSKAPTGRDVPDMMANAYCTDSCPGYAYQPLPGDLWPGETRAEFGFACRTAEELKGTGTPWPGESEVSS